MEEGKEYHLRDVSISGNSVYSDEDYLRQMEYQAGATFNTYKIRENLSEMLTRYQNDGYPLIKIRDSVVVSDSVRLFILVDEGPRLKIGKIAITNNLTLNFTINPDFGQVEADPSEVNLTAFETYFNERRPFFVEGAAIFKYPLIAGSGWSRENLFYSRRVGRTPQGYPFTESNEYVKLPRYTRILGAFKLSGKTQNGWTLGVIENLTNNEYATIDSIGTRNKQLVEPMTNYFVARVQKDIIRGKTILGGIVTATNRFFVDSSMMYLPKAAYSAGIDFEQYWLKKTYSLWIHLKR